MARDYKNNSGNKKKRKTTAQKEAAAARAGMAKGLFFGVLVGLSAASTWFLMQPEKDCPEPPPAPECPAQPIVVEPAETKTYDYYHLLPGLEVVVPPEEAPRRPAPAANNSSPAGPAAPRPTVNPNATYMLQVGSFKEASDAERRKAELALMGFQASVHTAAIDANTTYHRLRLGPFKTPQALDAAQNKLDANAIDALLIRVSE